MTNDLTNDILRLVADIAVLDPKHGMADAVQLLFNGIPPEAQRSVCFALQDLRSERRDAYEWIVLAGLRDFAGQNFSEETIAGLTEWLLTARGLRRRDLHTKQPVLLGERLSVEDALVDREGLVLVRDTIHAEQGDDWLPEDPAQRDLLCKWVASL